jgi:hypothetical protein
MNSAGVVGAASAEVVEQLASGADSSVEASATGGVGGDAPAQEPHPTSAVESVAVSSRGARTPDRRIEV